MNSDKYRYVVVEGPIGVGKTTLARKLAESLGAQMLLEEPRDNPFLERFYREAGRYALATQMHFLLHRIGQIRDLMRIDLATSRVVSDYLLEKDLLFAQLTLESDELELYRRLHMQLQPAAPVPDLVIYLQAEPEVLIDRIKRRGVAMESGISEPYVHKLCESYSRFFYHYDTAPLLIVNNENLNPIDSDEDFGLLIDHINNMRGKREFFNRERDMAGYLQDAAGNARTKAVTVPSLTEMKAGGQGQKIAMLTCYDASFASLMDRCGVDTLLIGDSLGMVCQGHDSTLPVTVADVAYHTACVARGNRSALLVADMPFGSYATPEAAFNNAATLIRAGAHMVKLEGGAWLADTVRFLTDRAIPVCAHLGLTPQSVHQMGGYKVQGKTDQAAAKLKSDAQALQHAGAQLMVLEAIPSTLGRDVTNLLAIPTIGIGAGPDCSGQVLVMHDLLGVFPGRKARFVKNFMDGRSSVEDAVRAYVSAVKDGSFPAPEHCF